MEEKIRKLFEFVEEYVMAECGDGWGLIVSNNYKELANLFEKYQREYGRIIRGRDDLYLQIVFSADQESISFVDDKCDTNLSNYDVAVKVNNII